MQESKQEVTKFLSSENGEKKKKKKSTTLRVLYLEVYLFIITVEILKWTLPFLILDTFIVANRGFMII